MSFAPSFDCANSWPAIEHLRGSSMSSKGDSFWVTPGRSSHGRGASSKRERHSGECLALEEGRSVTVDLAYEPGLIGATEERGVGADQRDQAASFEAQRESVSDR